MKKFNRSVSIILLTANFYFIAETIWLLNDNNFGGPYFSAIPLLISLFINFTLLTSIAVITKYSHSKFLLAINILGLLAVSLYTIVEAGIYLESR